MTPGSKYATGNALRTALEERLKRESLDQGIDLQKLRRFLFVPDRREQQLAEKLHAYTQPRPGAPNSRVRDLVDMVLLIDSGTLDPIRVTSAIEATFRRRATHPVPDVLAPPPDTWVSPFARLAAECNLDLPRTDAFEILRKFCGRF